MKIVPRTALGKWSLVLICLFGLMLLLFFVMVNVFDQRGGEHLWSNLLLFLPMLIAALSAAASFVTGLISFFKERALLVFVSTIIGLLVTIYVVMEFAFPH